MQSWRLFAHNVAWLALAVAIIVVVLVLLGR
jgi:hypothetical protein